MSGGSDQSREKASAALLEKGEGKAWRYTALEMRADKAWWRGFMKKLILDRDVKIYAHLQENGNHYVIPPAAQPKSFVGNAFYGRWMRARIPVHCFKQPEAIGCGTVGQGSISFLMRITALSCIKGFHPAIFLEMRFVCGWMAFQASSGQWQTSIGRAS